MNIRQRDLFLFVFLFFAVSCDKLPVNGSLLLPSAGDFLRSGKKTTVGNADPQMQFKTDSDRQRFYSWIVREMYEQVYLQEPKSSADVASWANVLLQGGSIEGIYHGLVLSNDYANFERGTASVKAVRFYAEETVALHDLSLEKKDFDAKASKLVQDNISASLFTLKRQLGEQVLQEISLRKKDKASFSNWYAKMVLRWNSLGISFGLPERNKMDSEFHKNWAETHPLELIQWELLNRVHRVLNQLGGVSLDGK